MVGPDGASAALGRIDDGEYLGVVFVPVADGMPVMRPVDGLSANPGGRAVLLNEVAGCDVVIWWEKFFPIAAATVSALVMFGRGSKLSNKISSTQPASDPELTEPSFA